MEVFIADVEADAGGGDRRSGPSRGYSGVIGGVYRVVGPRGFEPRTSAV